MNVPVPPSNNALLDLSSVLRQQLCVTRHRAYERYQENAQWAKELLEGPKSQNGESFSASIHAASAQKVAVEELERQLVHEKEAQEVTRRRFVSENIVMCDPDLRLTCRVFEELMTSLKSVEDAAAPKECEEKVSSEKLLLLPSKTRKLEFVQL
ncbi:hypothetical protein PsorP6_008720 [Peronosclerospora sorghi]|uniref:Uncharacterized protein n=1 Tax=Peronosclerospora sorghi TaxID=230839 RepID=A0ACC0VZQ6_9STRA|nr:hypothetical protein PsorP6_008720 [Peronosclerospora sorghi]